ncbi:MAG: MFS transporter [Promethearchaeota archaeon]
MAMAFIFTIETPEFWTGVPPDINSSTLIIPFFLCLTYISIYPLIDFLFIALSKESDEGLTPFHKIIGDRIINLSDKKPIKVMLAISFYICVFILPPILLSIIGLPFIMIWVTWMLVYPLMILTFYGSKGYMAGVLNAYYHIPDIRRSIFLNFEDSKRGLKQFISEPIHYILIGLMLFVFVWAWISLFQTIAFFFTKILAISTMSSVFVFVTLFFGVMGYFTRFWGRKIKYRGIDIYFAAYLMAAIGINVLVNFLIVNRDKLSDAFNSHIFTNQITPNFLMFCWAAVIEEIVLIIFTTFYFIARNNSFIKNIKYSKITQCGQTFDPIPLFNFIKHRNPEIRKHAERTLLLMFERIPLKNEINLTVWKFKNSILDGLSDSNYNSRRLSYQILEQLERDVPDIILPWIIESMESPNYDKNIPILKSLIEADHNFVNKIPKEVILNLLYDSEWRVKTLGLELFSRLSKMNKELLEGFDFRNLINDPNSKIQIEILNTFAESSLKLPDSIIIEKIFHNDDEVRAAAIRNLKNLSLAGFNEKIISQVIPLMKDPSSSVRASIFDILAGIGKFKKNKIPLLPLLEGLTDYDKLVRISATLALMKYFKEQPNLLDLDEIISKIDPNNIEALNSIISLLGGLWKHNPEKILTTLLIFIKFENPQLKSNISNILVEKFNDSPDLIIQNLIKIPDVSGYITKGIIAKTIIEICKKDPINLIQKLIDFLEDENDDVKQNAISSLDGLIDKFPSNTDIQPILSLIQKDKNKQLRKEGSKLLSQIAKKNSQFVQPIIPKIIQTVNQQESSVQVVIFKSLLEIATVSPEIVPIDPFFNFLSDQDSFIRETVTKILGFIGYKKPLTVADILINKVLIDDEWIVREAAVSSLGNIIEHVEDKTRIIEKLVSLLDSEQSWVLRSVLIILSKIELVDNSYLPFEILHRCLKSDDSKVRSASAGILSIYSTEINEIIDDIIVLLGDNTKDVRASAINSTVKIIQKGGLNQMLSKLLKNLSDEGSLETQRSIALILGRTVKYEDESIKKRVISLLKIRCEMSQDPIICSTLQQLKED